MTTKTKALIASAAIAGLISGSAVRAFAGTTDGGKAGAGISGIEKMGCGGKGGCGGKDGCPGKDSCKGKGSCKGKNDCKGKGGCKSGDGGCKGKNTCKGKGGCKAEAPKEDK